MTTLRLFTNLVQTILITSKFITLAVTSTPTLSRIYDRAFDGIIPVEGISSSSFVGTDPKSKESVTRDLEEVGYLHDLETIVNNWAFNFNDSKYERKRNLYHVILTGGKRRYI